MISKIVIPMTLLGLMASQIAFAQENQDEPTKPQSTEIVSAAMTWKIATPNATDAQSCIREALEAVDKDARIANMGTELRAPLEAAIEESCRNSWETYYREVITWNKEMQEAELKSRDSINLSVTGHSRFANGDQASLYYEVAGKWTHKFENGQLNTYLSSSENRGKEIVNESQHAAGIGYERTLGDAKHVSFGKIDYAYHQVNNTKIVDILFGRGLSLWGDDYHGENKFAVSAAVGGSHNAINQENAAIVSILAKYDVKVGKGNLRTRANSIVPLNHRGVKGRRDNISISYEMPLNSFINAKVSAESYWDHSIENSHESIFKVGVSIALDGLHIRKEKQ